MTMQGCLEIKLSPILLETFLLTGLVPTWGTPSSSEGLESYSCDFFQTFKGFLWFYMKLGGKRLWLVMNFLEMLCNKPSMADCAKRVCFVCLKFSQCKHTDKQGQKSQP